MCVNWAASEFIRPDSGWGTAIANFLPHVSLTRAPLPWERFGAGLPNVEVHELQLNQGLNTLEAATVAFEDSAANSSVLAMKRSSDAAEIWAPGVSG